MLQIPTLTEMLEAGMHFGHRSTRWHPKMEPYIFTERNGVHVINLEITKKQLEGALEFVKNAAADGKVILFLGTKKQSMSIIEQEAKRCGMPYVTERWLGGLLTNFSELKKLINKYKDLKKKKEAGEFAKYTKKEQLVFEKELQKMSVDLSGIDTLEKMPDVLYVADMRAEKTAVREANRVNVPIVGVCDTNVDPTLAQFPIPANDDSVKSIEMIARLVASAVLEGREQFAQKQKAAAALVKKAPPKERKAEVVAQG